MKKWIVILGLLLTVPAFAQDKRVIKVGTSPTTSTSGVYLAQERGYFKEQGLEVELVNFNSSGAPMTALLSKGELDVGAGNITAGVFNAVTQGLKFKIVADKGSLAPKKDYLSLLVRNEHIKSGRYKTLKDLKGFKMGLTSLDGVSQEILTEKFLKKGGLKLSDVTFVKASYAEINIALASGALDASIQIEPFLTRAELDSIATRVGQGSDAYPNQQSGVLFYSPKFAQEKDLANKFMVAYAKGIKDYNNAFVNNIDKEKVIADLKKYVKIDDDKVWEKMSIVGLNEYGEMNLKELQDDIKWYEKLYIKKKLDTKDIIDTSFVEYAKKVLK